MEIRPHREQIKRFKRLHLREAGIVMFLTVAVPFALGQPIVTGVVFFVDILVVIVVISWKMRRCQCPTCGQTLKIPWRIPFAIFVTFCSSFIFAYRAKAACVLFTVLQGPFFPNKHSGTEGHKDRKGKGGLDSCDLHWIC